MERESEEDARDSSDSVTAVVGLRTLYASQIAGNHSSRRSVELLGVREKLSVCEPPLLSGENF